MQHLKPSCAEPRFLYSAPLALAGRAGSARSALASRVLLATGVLSSMSLYENVFIARQDISGAQVDALADTFAQLVADNGGEVKKREYWGLRNLAYRMRK